MKDFDFVEMAEQWGSAIVARSEVPRFTGGTMSSGYIANLDCQGLGPPRVRIGRKVAYPTLGFCEWLKQRASVD